MSHIYLDKEKGVNPVIVPCANPECKEGAGIAMLGINGYMATCQKCGKVSIGVGKLTSTCLNCKARALGNHVELTNKNMPPIEGFCNSCKKKIEDEVKAGGIYYRCLKCGSQGVVKRDADISIEIRKKVAAPDPVGVELPDCQYCQGEGDAA